MSALDRLLNRASRAVDLTPTEYVIVKQIHPKMRSPAGYYAIHPNRVWHWVPTKQQATTFRSEQAAQSAVVGSMVNVYHLYRIERL